MFKRINVKHASVAVIKLEQVKGCKVARSVIEEHVFAAWVGGINPTALWTSVPLVNRGIKLYARVSAVPCSIADSVPQS